MGGRLPYRRGWHLFSVAVLALAAPAAGAAQDKGDAGAPKAHSIYHYGLQVTRSDGRVMPLDELAGRPVVMTMFFATCPGICPMMTENIAQAEAKLPADKRRNLRVLMVSFDESDTPAMLEAYGKAHRLDRSRWIIAKATPAVSRTLGDLLGVRFAKLPNGSYSHTAMVDLVDENGEILIRVPGTSLDDPLFAVALDRMLSKQPTPSQ